MYGQARISYGLRTMSEVRLEPACPAANEEAVEAILNADLVVLGPGSLFTSIIPNVLVPGIRDALAATSATRVFVCPKIDSLGETAGMSVADHVEALVACGLEEARAVKHVKNQVNRRVNAELANQTRSAGAAQRQLELIEALDDLGLRPGLPEALETFCRLRENHPDLSLRDLGEMAQPPLSKSALYHRVLRLEKMVEEARASHEGD